MRGFMNQFILVLSFFMGSLLAEATGDIKIYSVSKDPMAFFSYVHRGRLILKNEEVKSTQSLEEAKKLYKSLKCVKDYFYEVHGRDSWDNKGADIIATIKVGNKIDRRHSSTNASWLYLLKPNFFPRLTERFILGAGDPNSLHDFESAVDVIGHEFTHAIIGAEGTIGKAKEAGAIEEHLADVFGVLIEFYFKQKYSSIPLTITDVNFLFGDSVVGQKENKKNIISIRNLLNPQKFGYERQPIHVKQINAEAYKKCKPSVKNDQCFIHSLTGIPNRMAALFIQSVGPEVAEKFFYEFITTKIKSKDVSPENFKEYASALKDLCVKSPHGYNASTCNHLNKALSAVGLE
jgi:Zn-dependent metalloprotease